MKLIKLILLGAMLVFSMAILAVPVLQNPLDKETLSNPDAEKTPLLTDSTMTGKVTTLYYPWNAIKILHKKGTPKISFTASPKGVMVTATVFLDVHRQQLRESLDDFKETHTDWQQVNLVPIHPEKGEYSFALRAASGKRHYFPNSTVDNTIPKNQVVVSLSLAGTEANGFVDALMKGAVMEIHYQYQFSALINAQNTHTQPVQVHSKIELNGYCDAFPRHFNYQLLKGGQFEQGCLPDMEVTNLSERLTHQQICEILPEFCKPAPTMASREKPEKSSDAEYCLMFPDDIKCQKPKMAKGGISSFYKDIETMKEICETDEPNSSKCVMWKKIETEFASCFFNPECHTFNISISEEKINGEEDINSEIDQQ